MGAEQSKSSRELRLLPPDRRTGPSVFGLSELYPFWTDAIKHAAISLKIPTDANSFQDLAPQLESVTYTRATQRGRPYRFVVLVGTQSVGKTAIRNSLIEQHGFSNFRNHVTRPARRSELDGLTAHFVSEAELYTMERNDELVSPPRVQAHSTREPEYRSAASKKEFLTLLSSSQPFVVERRLESWDVMADTLRHQPGIDPQAIDDALIIMLLPPSLEVLASRAVQKGTDAHGAIDGDEIRKQIERSFGKEKAQMIIDAAARQNVVFVVNDTLERAAGQIAALLREGETTTRRHAA